MTTDAEMPAQNTDVDANRPTRRSFLTATGFAAAGIAGGAVGHSTGPESATAAVGNELPSLESLSALYLGKSELHFSVRDFGAVGNGLVDDGPAIQATIDAAMASNPTTAISGKPANQASVVFFPPGVYYIATSVRKVINSIPGPNVDRRRLTIRGAATNSVVVLFDAATEPVGFSFSTGFLTLENIQFDGSGTYAGVMLEMGLAGKSQVVNQFNLNRLHFGRVGPGGTALRAQWAFDGSVTDCLWLNLGKGAVGLDLPAQIDDNCNNWAFRRCHWEQGVGATFIRARSLLGGSNYHTGFSFDQCHFESRSFDTRLLDLQGCSRWTFISCSFPHNNYPTGEAAGVSASDVVNALRFVDCNSIQFLSGGISRQDPPADWPRKLIALGGRVRAIRFTGTYFNLNTLTGSATATKADIWEVDATNPLSAAKGNGPLQTAGCMINSFSRSEMFDEISGWADQSSSAVWTSRFDPMTKGLVFGYGPQTDDVATRRVDRLVIGKDGGLSAGYYSAAQVSIPDAGSNVFKMSADRNPNRRGVFLIHANDTAGSYALVFSSGASIDVISAGALFSVGTKDPGAPGKYNLFLTGVDLTITNRRGSERTVAVVPFGFQ